MHWRWYGHSSIDVIRTLPTTVNIQILSHTNTDHTFFHEPFSFRHLWVVVEM